MVKYPMTHFPIRHDGWFSCLQYFSVINSAVDTPYTHSYTRVRLSKRLMERRQPARVGARPGLLGAELTPSVVPELPRCPTFTGTLFL